MARGGGAARSRTSRTSGWPASTALSSSKAAARGRGDDPRERRLAGARRPVEDHRVRPALLDRAPQGRARGEQVLLADDVGERARAHADGERRLGRPAPPCGRGRRPRRCRRAASVIPSWSISPSSSGASWWPLAGGLVGLVLGNLRLPATLLFAVERRGAARARTSSSAPWRRLTASIAHIRAGRVNWRLFAWMAPPSIVGAVLGGYLSGEHAAAALLLASSPRCLLLQRLRAARAGSRRPQRARSRRVRTPSTLNIRAPWSSGAVIGLLGGIVGLILGSLRMPALLRVVGETPRAGGRDERHRRPAASASRARSGTCPRGARLDGRRDRLARPRSPARSSARG